MVDHTADERTEQLPSLAELVQTAEMRGSMQQVHEAETRRQLAAARGEADQQSASVAALAESLEETVAENARLASEVARLQVYSVTLRGKLRALGDEPSAVEPAAAGPVAMDPALVEAVEAERAALQRSQGQWEEERTKQELLLVSLHLP
jgi:hypothetical protein